MEEKQEKQIQHKIIYDFNQLVEKVKEDKTKFLDLIDYLTVGYADFLIDTWDRS